MNLEPINNTNKKKRNTGVPKFLRNLYQILKIEDQSIIAWSFDGKSIQVFDAKRVESEILRKYFKHSKFASFQRQLNYFGFRKWTKTQSSVCTFSHPHFIRNSPKSLELVARKSSTPQANNGEVSRSTWLPNYFTESLMAEDVSDDIMQFGQDIKKYNLSKNGLVPVNPIDVCYVNSIQPLVWSGSEIEWDVLSLDSWDWKHCQEIFSKDTMALVPEMDQSILDTTVSLIEVSPNGFYMDDMLDNNYEVRFHDELATNFFGQEILF